MFKQLFTDYTANGDYRIDIHFNGDCEPPQVEITIEFDPNNRPTLTLEMQEVRDLSHILSSMWYKGRPAANPNLDVEDRR